MADTDDVDHEAGVEYLVKDPVVADPDSVHGLFSGQGNAAWRPGLVAQQVDSGADPLLFPERQRGDRLERSPCDFDGVATHPSPSAALTSSQGT